jgi:taurine dioxygenase
MSQFNLEGAPEILMVSSDRHPDGRPKGIADAGRYWHTDMSYMAEPALGSLLYARAIPGEGGDTMFCDMTAACRDLPPDRLEQLLKAKAVHHFASRWARESAKAGMRPQQTREEQDRNPPVEHPMIRTHPETGEPAIYCGGFVVRIAGLPEREGEELLSWVNDWVAQSKYVYRHKWRLHDLVFWDNRRVMHHATPYPESERRHMHRTTVKGSAPYLDRQYFARAASSTP